MIGIVAPHSDSQTMRQWLQNFLTGAGSLIVIMPPESRVEYADFLPQESIEDTLRGDWYAVGDAIRDSMAEASKSITVWVEPAEKNVSGE